MSGSVSGLPPPRPVRSAMEVGFTRADGQRSGDKGTYGPQSAAKVTLSARGVVIANALRRFLKDEPSRSSLVVADNGPEEPEIEESPQERVRKAASQRVEKMRERAEQADDRPVADFAEGYVRLYHSQHPELTEAEAREEVRKLISAHRRRKAGAARTQRRSSVGERGHTLEARG